ncbi:MAG: hypothetical protein MI748_20240 [Opitutales bacterium]|nr:hypothetical protein [Opitutales bacterium]
MKLETEDLVFLCEHAIDAAKDAGNLIARYSQKEVEVNKKEGVETYAAQVVTEVDYLSQDVILKNLEPTLSKFDLGILTEETEDNGERLQKDYFWCIDPMDGTLPFIEKTHGYSVSIGLVSRSGAPKVGVVFDPLKSTLYHAIAGVGAFKNEDMWFQDQSQNVDALTWVMDRSLMDDFRYSALMTKMKFYASSKHLDLNLIQTGGGALNACWVLDHAPACYFKLPKKGNGGGGLWDYSASACIHECIGSSVSDIFGKPLDLNREDSTFMNHRGILYASDCQLAADLMKICQNTYETHPQS